MFEGMSRLEFSEVFQNHLTFDEQGQWSRCVMFGKRDFRFYSIRSSGDGAGLVVNILTF